jgi:hypothetical protein
MARKTRDRTRQALRHRKGEDPRPDPRFSDRSLYRSQSKTLVERRRRCYARSNATISRTASVRPLRAPTSLRSPINSYRRSHRRPSAIICRDRHGADALAQQCGRGDRRQGGAARLLRQELPRGAGESRSPVSARPTISPASCRSPILPSIRCTSGARRSPTWRPRSPTCGAGASGWTHVPAASAGSRRSSCCRSGTLSSARFSRRDMETADRQVNWGDGCGVECAARRVRGGPKRLWLRPWLRLSNCSGRKVLR